MTKLAAIGTEFRRSTDAFVANDTLIAQVREISGPGLTLDVADVTSHDSTGKWEEVVPTILRSGEVTLDLLFDPDDAGHINLWTDLKDRVLRDWRIVWTDAAPAKQWTFKGYIVGFEPSAPHDGELSAAVTMKITGQPTLA